jgi:uncharacterized protein
VRVVLDTNVFVSGAFFGGPPGGVLEGWRDRELEVVISREIIEEHVRVGEKLLQQFPGVDLRPALDLVAASAKLVRAEPLTGPACRDPDDDKFLACAVTASAQYVVTGDRDLLDVSPCQGVIVMRPKNFVQGVVDKTAE